MIFLESWSLHQPDNNYLLNNLTLRLNCMNLYCMQGQFKKYVNPTRIDCPLLVTNDPLLLHMMHGMLFAKNVSVHYNVIGVFDLNYS